MQEKYEFRLSATELEYLKLLVSRDQSAPSLIRVLESAPGNKTTIQMSLTDAERLRDFLPTHLATVGFDERYAPNEQGKMLEQLIDRFHISET